ncbi:11315_t:CDS:2, partial [Funneliformis geosporum]
IYAFGDIGEDWHISEGFTGIDDMCILSGNIISESRAKETPDLKLVIKAINAIAGN